MVQVSMMLKYIIGASVFDFKFINNTIRHYSALNGESIEWLMLIAKGGEEGKGEKIWLF